MTVLAITRDDAMLLALALQELPDGVIPQADHERLLQRLALDEGGNMDEVAHALKHLDLCAACQIEGRASSCSSIEAQKLGRRLARWLARASSPAEAEKENPSR